MKKRTMNSIITMAVLVIILLAGCQKSSKSESTQSGLPKTSTQSEIHIPVPIDTSAMDEEFYRRMRLFDAMFPDRGLDK